MSTLVDLCSTGKAVIFSTHRMDQVEKFCNSIALIHRGHLILSGSMREVKSGYSRNRVLIHFEGDDAFLNHPSIEHLKRYNGHVEIKLRPSATLAEDAQSLLTQAVRNARVTRFEVMEPTLEEIFIEKVQKTLPIQDSGKLVVDQLKPPNGGRCDA
jgi:ABC-2 type transport system ATP-binding protein